MRNENQLRKSAATMPARYDVVFISDTHIGAAAAYGLGKKAVAEELTESPKPLSRCGFNRACAGEACGTETAKRTLT